MRGVGYMATGRGPVVFLGRLVLGFVDDATRAGSLEHEGGKVWWWRGWLIGWGPK